MMTAQPALTLAVELEDAANLSGVGDSSDREALKDLFKLIEKAEPTLLLCRDALAASPLYAIELKAIQATLDDIREVKSNRLHVGNPRQPHSEAAHLQHPY
ncbi:MAG: hypothetical protein WA609_19280 [Terriglobales bacterium]